MATYVNAPNISLAWLEALERIHEAGHSLINLTIAVDQPFDEDPSIRKILDDLLQQTADYSVETVAGTIFPDAFYLPKLGADAREHLYNMHTLERSVSRRLNRRGTYFQRLVDWESKDAHYNQLENTIEKIKRELSNRRTTANRFEISLGQVADELAAINSEHPTSNNLHVYMPERDRNVPRGFPCLSHLSLTLWKGKLTLTALYRNQHFYRKAYGNYLGLSHLLRFFCNEAGCEPGELLCLATHADPELSMSRIGDIILACRAVPEAAKSNPVLIRSGNSSLS